MGLSAETHSQTMHGKRLLIRALQWIPPLRARGTPTKQGKEDFTSQGGMKDTKRTWPIESLRSAHMAHRDWKGKRGTCKGLHQVLSVYVVTVGLVFCGISNC